MSGKLEVITPHNILDLKLGKFCFEIKLPNSIYMYLHDINHKSSSDFAAVETTGIFSARLHMITAKKHADKISVS